jgi:co-chaperonin GroES (HSP10)
VTFRPYADNVLLQLEPEPTETKSGLAMVRLRSADARHSRTARVLASGPGYHGKPTYLNPSGLFHPNEVKPGDRVLVDALCGNKWDLDLSAPRQNENPVVPFLAAPSLGETRAELRIVRHDEILAVLSDEAVIGDAVQAA